jgi:hypothetical protein
METRQTQTLTRRRKRGRERRGGRGQNIFLCQNKGVR